MSSPAAVVNALKIKSSQSQKTEKELYIAASSNDQTPRRLGGFYLSAVVDLYEAITHPDV